MEISAINIAIGLGVGIVVALTVWGYGNTPLARWVAGKLLNLCGEELHKRDGAADVLATHAAAIVVVALLLGVSVLFSEVGGYVRKNWICQNVAKFSAGEWQVYENKIIVDGVTENEYNPTTTSSRPGFKVYDSNGASSTEKRLFAPECNLDTLNAMMEVAGVKFQCVEEISKGKSYYGWHHRKWLRGKK
jgi:hypothetical protein